MAFKLVHCADIHIGAPISGLDDSLASIRREEIKASLKNIVQFSDENKADALLICGDLFDSPFPNANDINFVRNLFLSIPHINIYILCGNHDYLCTGSVFSDKFADIENVFIFPENESYFEIENKNVLLWGKSYSSPTTTPSFLSTNFEDDKINILCLHGTVGGSDNNAIERETLCSFSFNYAAFGHIHDGSVFEIGNTKCAYCGTPEGHGFNDSLNTGFIFAQISEDETKIEHICNSTRKYIYRDIDITQLESNDEIANEIKNVINNTDLFKISLTGVYNPTFELSVSYIESLIKEMCFYIKIADETSPVKDISAIENEESLRGYFVRNLKKLAADDTFDLALRIGLNALEGRKTDL